MKSKSSLLFPSCTHLEKPPSFLGVIEKTMPVLVRSGVLVECSVFQQALDFVSWALFLSGTQISFLTGLLRASHGRVFRVCTPTG